MGFLQNKRVLIVGVASSRSIAAGIASSMAREGAKIAFTYQTEKLKSRVEKIANECHSDPKLLFPCDVGRDEQIDNVFDKLSKYWDGLDTIVHSVAFAPREQLQGSYIDAVTRKGFSVAHDISAYSFAALAKAGKDMMVNRNGSLITLSYLGAERAIDNYNVMGVAKASLEANVRYMAHSLGKQGIRVNAISAGPIKTLSSAGIGDFGKMLAYGECNSPLRRNVTIEEIGNVAAFMCSDLASGITGEITYVDAGYNIVGIGNQ
ncbi:MAG: enoyl-ACP reductase [Piscirickettsiaceae bacterium]|nr:enoyl-ACP reductase [Piscirickettsiaceae bacterium]